MRDTRSRCWHLPLRRTQRSEGRPALSRWLADRPARGRPRRRPGAENGHPEELLTTALCVGGMLLVIRGRITTGAILLGLAVASKQWALLALPIALAVLPRDQRHTSLGPRRLRCLALFAPLALPTPAISWRPTRVLPARPSSFVPQQIWWTLHLDYVRHLGGLTRRTRRRLALVARYSRPLIVLARSCSGSHTGCDGAGCSLAMPCCCSRSDAAARHARSLGRNLLSASVPREPGCLGGERPPRSSAVYVGGHRPGLDRLRTGRSTSSGDITNLFYIAWALPAAVLMGWRSLRLPRPAPTRTRYATTVSSLESRCSTS